MRHQRCLTLIKLRCVRGLAPILTGLALILLSAVGPARAHGGGTLQLNNVDAGPYQVSVWTEPEPIRVGELHVTVAVVEAIQADAGARPAGDLMLDATIRVQVEHVGQTEETLVAFATRENAVNKLFYEADLHLPAEGQWQVVVAVEGPEGTGSVDFTIEVLPPSGLRRLQLQRWPLWGGLGLVLIATIWSVQFFRDRGSETQDAEDR